MFNKDSGDRFKIIYKQGMMTGFRIVQDRETGVNYLMTYEEDLLFCEIPMGRRSSRL